MFTLTAGSVAVHQEQCSILTAMPCCPPSLHFLTLWSLMSRGCNMFVNTDWRAPLHHPIHVSQAWHWFWLLDLINWLIDLIAKWLCFNILVILHYFVQGALNLSLNDISRHRQAKNVGSAFAISLFCINGHTRYQNVEYFQMWSLLYKNGVTVKILQDLQLIQQPTTGI